MSNIERRQGDSLVSGKTKFVGGIVVGVGVVLIVPLVLHLLVLAAVGIAVAAFIYAVVKFF